MLDGREELDPTKKSSCSLSTPAAATYTRQYKSSILLSHPLTKARGEVLIGAVQKFTVESNNNFGYNHFYTMNFN